MSSHGWYSTIEIESGPIHIHYTDTILIFESAYLLRIFHMPRKKKLNYKRGYLSTKNHDYQPDSGRTRSKTE